MDASKDIKNVAGFCSEAVYKVEEEAIKEKLKKLGTTNPNIIITSGDGDDSEGYFAALISAEVNGKTEYFLTRKGSDFDKTKLKETFRDLDDMGRIGLGLKVNEVKSDEAFLKKVIEVLPQGVKYYDVGHSKAATLSQVSTIKYPELSLGAIVFESPGKTPEIVKKYATQEQINARRSSIYIENSLPNFITSGSHLVTPHYIKQEVPVDDIGWWNSVNNFGNLGYYGAYSFATHSMETLNKNRKQIEPQLWDGSWPSSSKQWFDQNFEIKINRDDLSRASLISRATNNVLGFGDSGTQRLTQNTYIVRDVYGTCAQDVADRHGVHVDNVIENTIGTSFLDLHKKRFTIISDQASPTAHGNKKPFLSSFKPSASEVDFLSYSNPVIDSFIRGTYTGFYDLNSYLISPFQRWTALDVGKDGSQKIDFLKEVGFYRSYNLNAEDDYRYTATVSDIIYDYRYIQHQTYARFDPIQRQIYNVGYQSVHYQTPPFSGGNWAKKYYDKGYGYEYNRPGSGFTLEIRRMLPIAISLDGDISLVPYEKSPVFFDIDDDGYYENVAWVGSKDTILVYDYDQNGVVNSAKEIIFTKWDETAKTDFEAFKNKFDTNKDNKFNKEDSEFNKFYVWQDLNQDGISQAEELSSLETKGITSIDLAYEPSTDEMKAQGILNTAKVSWINNKETKAYDLTLSHSVAGIRYAPSQNTITIKLSEGSVYQTLRAEPQDRKLDIDLTNTPAYHIILGSTDNDKIVTSIAPQISSHVTNQGLVIDGKEGDDIIVTGNGNDWVKGGPGIDHISTGPGHDILFIDSEDKKLDGGDGFDVAFVTTSQGVSIDLEQSNIEAFYGNGGNDVIVASNSKEAVQIHGHAGDDEIIGSDYDDILIGGLGKDKISAGKGDDKVFIDAEDDISNIDAGEGEDSIHVMGSKGVTLDLDTVNAENFIGNDGDDIVKAHGNKKYIMYGGKGNDELTGGSHDNVLDGGPGNDILHGGQGNNKYMLGPDYDHDIIFSQGKGKEEGRDLVLLSSKIEKQDIIFSQQEQDLRLEVKGTSSSITVKKWFNGAQYQIDGFVYKADDTTLNQHIILHENKKRLFLKNSKDWIVFSLLNTDSVIEGGSGSEFFRLGSGNDLVIGGGGNDIVYAGPGNDEIIAWDSNDKEYTGGNVEFHGEEGNDTLVGCKGNDILNGGEGNDVIIAKEGDDTIYTGNGNDKVIAGIGNDKIIIQGVGTKEIYGGPGSDIFIIEPSDIKEIGKYIIGDFDINDKKEKIDFSRMSPLIKSLDPKYLGVFDHMATIDPSICQNIAENSNNLLICKENAEKKVASASMCWTIGPGTEDYYRCVTLVGITKEQILSSRESFIFAD